LERLRKIQKKNLNPVFISWVDIFEIDLEYIHT
jgi:hypothetical protein